MKRFEVSSTPDHARNRWSIDQEITPGMQGLMDAVAALLDAGVYYDHDIFTAIIPQFDFSDEGGIVSLDIGYARQRVELARLLPRKLVRSRHHEI